MPHLDLSLSSCLRLDYLSCLLTVVSTILVGRKQWTGLLIGSLNSLLICAIGWRTAQFGFIPANLFCIGIYGFSIRSWLKETVPVRAEGDALEESESGTALEAAAGTADFTVRAARRYPFRPTRHRSHAGTYADSPARYARAPRSADADR